MPTIELADLERTRALAAALAARLGPGDLVLIDGEIGAGKTTLTRFLVAALGGDANAVASPTYTLLNRYAARLPVYHVDAFRLRAPAELAAIGFDELRDDGVGVVEWAGRLEPAFDRRRAWSVRLDHRGGVRVAAVAKPEDGTALPLHWPEA